MIKTISIAVIFTFLGQLLGFIAEILIANNFGTNWKADAYFLALVIPTILYDLFIAGINAIFIPTYIVKQKDGKADSLFSAVTNIAVLILSFIAVVTFLLSPYLINLIARGFSSEARELTVIITRVLLILVITMPLATIMSCRLNAHNRFALPALGKSFNFAFIIIFLTLLNNSLDIYSLPLGFIVGNIFFIFSLILLSYKEGLGYSLHINMRDPVLKEMGILFLPIIAATVVNYANILIERSVAAGFPEGSIAALNYAFRLINIPLNLFILTGMAVVLPAYSRYVVAGDIDSLREHAYKGLRFVSFFITPVIVGMLIFRTPLVKLLFERGEFTSQSTELTSTALLFYVFGLLGLVAVTVMSRVFYALKDIKKLSVVGILIILLNIVLILSLSKAFGFAGIPLTFSITSTVHMLVLAFLLGRRLKAPLLTPMTKVFFKHLSAAAIMGLVSTGFVAVTKEYAGNFSSITMSVYLLLAAMIGFASYIAISYALKVKEAEYVLNITGTFNQKS
ncbi:MAG: murein biosynthesis integral membrane protein MurJ [Nitrospinae bacterium RIFCSPLOWO2_12_39_15]|nr:MAG: murein biosynthesis integral membrane protein MurJ [Nitrospinae bacterium RIFCSPLOWO2_12_39_15]